MNAFVVIRAGEATETGDGRNKLLSSAEVYLQNHVRKMSNVECTYIQRAYANQRAYASNVN